MRYKTTTKGTQLPDRWGLPDALRDDTGVIFASAFPATTPSPISCRAITQTAPAASSWPCWRACARKSAGKNGDSALAQEIDQRIEELRTPSKQDPYVFDRRFLFRVLSMGHSQFAEFIGARGPNTQINAACASTAQAVALAEDWIRAGRCRRVIVISADDVTSDHLLEWFGAGFLASGAAATDEVVEDAAIPFDRRRHGMMMGMGAAALVVESAEAARERGIQPICEVLSAVTANSAFHGTRLDVQHIGQVMENLVPQAETTQRHFASRDRAADGVRLARNLHSRARRQRLGGDPCLASRLRRRRRSDRDRQHQGLHRSRHGHGHRRRGGGEGAGNRMVPPVANFKEVDPELGPLNLSKGGAIPSSTRLRLGAGFGSQISMTLLRWVPTKDGVRPQSRTRWDMPTASPTTRHGRLGSAGSRALRRPIWKWCSAPCACRSERPAARVAGTVGFPANPQGRASAKLRQRSRPVAAAAIAAKAPVANPATSCRQPATKASDDCRAPLARPPAT